MSDKPLVLKRPGEDGTKVISLRIRQETLDALDELAKDANYSRNEVINIILEYGVENIQIK